MNGYHPHSAGHRIFVPGFFLPGGTGSAPSTNVPGTEPGRAEGSSECGPVRVQGVAGLRITPTAETRQVRQRRKAGPLVALERARARAGSV